MGATARREASTGALVNGLLTIDVEDWQHANFQQLDGREEEMRSLAAGTEYAMDRNTDRWIELSAAAGVQSTCFVLGEFAEKYPGAVRRLHDAGHEIASHSYRHDLIYRMTREGFVEQLKRSTGALGDLTGEQPLGFRAPSWSVDDARTPWFCEELASHGFSYDSSEFPVKTNLYGSSTAVLEPRYVGELLRIPVTAVYPLGRLRVPFLSGAFFRLVPRRLIRLGLRRMVSRGLRPMAILHPRELDPGHPRLPLKGWEGYVHYARLGSTIPKLESILGEGTWGPIAREFGFRG
ncbi:MAG: DUF3473 domain-containing protein [Actinobacteria bacterium]|jgi:polysaccharide deacetylase family protein (PEP-CTERM system associated)|nr:DUF3473 domain-containing protein [Actinomycetota bacterium]